MPSKDTISPRPPVKTARKTSKARFKFGDAVIVPFGIRKFPAMVTEHDQGRVQVIIDVGGVEIRSFYSPEEIERVD